MKQITSILPKGVNQHHAWQVRLRDRFFNKAQAGKRVRFHLDKDDFPIEGGDLASLLDAVNEAVRTERCENVLQLLAVQAKKFKRRAAKARKSNEPPPAEPPDVLPGLAVLVIAVHHGDNRFAPHEYYGRLQDLMGYGAAVDINSGPMSKANQAWAVLEEWSCRMQLGRCGRFEVRVLGGNRFIGVPLRQALLSPRDEAGLVETFLQSNIDPQSHLSASAAITLGERANLRSRAQNLTREYPRTLESRDLADDICEVFEHWQGEGGDGQRSAIRRSQIRLHARARVDQSLRPARAFVDLPSDRQSTERIIARDLEAKESLVSIERPETAGFARELVTQGGESLADTIDWFQEYTWTIDGDDGGQHYLRRDARTQIFFESVGELRLEERFEHELEDGPTYLAVRPRADNLRDITETDWKPLDWPEGCEYRGHRHAVGNKSDTIERIVCRLKNGVRGLRGASTYLDFAAPTVTWTGFKTPPKSVLIRALDCNGAIVHDGSREPTRELIDVGLLAEYTDVRSAVYQVNVRTIVSELHLRSIHPAAIELYVQDAEDRTRRVIYLEETAICSQIDPPPSRDEYGQLAVDGRLRGRTGRTPLDFNLAIRDDPTGKPITLDSVPPTDDSPHMRVSRLLRSYGSIRWSRAREMIAECGAIGSFNDRRDLTNQILALHQAGVLELVERPDGGFERVQTLPPRLAITGRRLNLGMKSGGGFEAGRKFALTGAWLPTELRQLYKKSVRLGGLIPRLEDPSVSDTLLPGDRSIVAITEDAIGHLREVASELGVEFEPHVPDAISSLSVMSPIIDILDRLHWVPGSPPEYYDQWEFDPDRLCRTRSAISVPRIGLNECKHPDRPIWRYFLYDHEHDRHAAISDRQFGRWLVRRLSHPDAPVPVGSLGEVVIPLELRLPRHLERMFALESGSTPETVWFGDEGSMSSPFKNETTASLFDIPAPPRTRIRPYDIPEKACGAFLLYPTIHGTPLWPRDTPMPVLGARAKAISTIGLKSESRSRS